MRRAPAPASTQRSRQQMRMLRALPEELQLLGQRRSQALISKACEPLWQYEQEGLAECPQVELTWALM